VKVFKWIELRDTKIFRGMDDIEQLIEYGKETAEKLDRVKHSMEMGFFDTSAFNDAVSNFTRMLFALMSIARAYQEKIMDEKGIPDSKKSDIRSQIIALTNDLRNMLEGLNKADVEHAINEARIGKYGSISMIVQLMDSMLYAYIYDVLLSTIRETKKEFYGIFVKNALKRGGIVPKFKELMKEEKKGVI